MSIHTVILPHGIYQQQLSISTDGFLLFHLWLLPWIACYTINGTTKTVFTQSIDAIHGLMLSIILYMLSIFTADRLHQIVGVESHAYFYCWYNVCTLTNIHEMLIVSITFVGRSRSCCKRNTIGDLFPRPISICLRICNLVLRTLTFGLVNRGSFKFMNIA